MSHKIENNYFKPIEKILFVEEVKSSFLSIDKIAVELVGEKAYGLSCMPSAWTLPFFVISGELFSFYKNTGISSSTKLLQNWEKSIKGAISQIGFTDDQSIIIRSSGYQEGLGERGKLYSNEGYVYDISDKIIQCINKIYSDDDIKENSIPLIVQMCISPISKKGHLSNERRVCKEHRDWFGEYDHFDSVKDTVFEIHLRSWREKINIENYINKGLICNLSPHISEVLKIPATWATQKQIRLHYEWVWNGECLFIVQADQEKKVLGINPNNIFISKPLIEKYSPLCLKLINNSHEKFNKIHNVFIYRKLGFAEVPIYVLDDRSVINDLVYDVVPEKLKKDIEFFVRGSLVIRMDVDSEDQGVLQLLPRTQEVRNVVDALAWLKEKTQEIRKNIENDIIFIFHNFIPAISSAFVYAAPGERKVQIESLWGLPEGLYYNSHDKYIVDTKNSKIKEIDEVAIQLFDVRPKINYKHYFVKPDEQGLWKTEIVQPPYDLSPSIKKKEWIKQIAYESRCLAEEEKKPLSVMWFIGVPSKVNNKQIIPWHHEYCQIKDSNRSKINRKKKPFEQSIIIRKTEDIAKLERQINEGKLYIKSIRIQPQEDELLRDKNTLKKIGELCKKTDSIILLEGGILSHAYYQLMQINAVVEVVHPFVDKEEVSEYYKLIRDNIVTNITDRGEKVDYIRLNGENLLKALKNKLIEESFEVLDANDQESIISEIADVEEVMSAILSHLNVKSGILEKVRKQKKEKSGGFEKGLVLIKTINIIPTKQDLLDNDMMLFDEQRSNQNDISSIYSQSDIDNIGKKIEKWTDRKKHQAVIESVLHLFVPIILDKWNARSSEIEIDKEKRNTVMVEITGKRNKNNIEIDLSVYIDRKEKNINDRQLELLF